MLKLSLCDYSEGYVLVSGTISAADISDAGAAASNANKRVTFKNCTPLIDWISEINSPQVDNTKDIDIVMPMYNSVEYSDNYLKRFGRLWRYYVDVASLNNVAVFNFTGANHNSKSFKYEQKITRQAGYNCTKNVKTMGPLKCLSNFWRSLEMLLINCEINLFLAWSEKCVLSSNAAAYQATEYTITECSKNLCSSCNFINTR